LKHLKSLTVVCPHFYGQHRMHEAEGDVLVTAPLFKQLSVREDLPQVPLGPVACELPAHEKQTERIILFSQHY